MLLKPGFAYKCRIKKQSAGCIDSTDLDKYLFHSTCEKKKKTEDLL